MIHEFDNYADAARAMRGTMTPGKLGVWIDARRQLQIAREILRMVASK
jgi:hypothetical protein